MNEKQNQKKKVMILILVLGLVLLTIGGTYAFFTYSREGVKLNTLTTGTMYFVYDELPNQDGNQISISNAFPMTDDKGKNQEQPGMFEFQVRATTQGAPIYYEVYLTNESDSLELEALPEKVVKTYLTDASNGEEEPIINHWTSQGVNLFNELWVSQVPPVTEDLSGRTLLQDEAQDNVQDYVKTYRYRMWLDNNANKVNKDGEWVYGNKAFSVHVNVYASNEKLPDPIPPRATFMATSRDVGWFKPSDIAVNNNQITSISFVKPSEVPSETVTSWDVTASDSKDAGKVTAYLVKDQSSEEETYSVYISSNAKTIYLNANSSYFFGNEWTSNFNNLKQLNGLKTLDTSEVTNMSYMFSWCNLSTFNLSNWDTSSVTDMSYMFWGEMVLTELNLSNWDTSSVTNMSNMFSECNQLTTVGDLSGWDVSNVTDMSYMFGGCSQLTDIGNLSSWDTSSVTDMSYMFGRVQIKDFSFLENWNTSKVIDIKGMFNMCSQLQSLDLSNWNVKNVTSIGETSSSSFRGDGMFNRCTSLQVVDLSSFDFLNIENYGHMFENCSQLTTIYVKDEANKEWLIANAKDFYINSPDTVVQVKSA